ncbi:hypothetical protein ACFO9E_03480 [Streptomyces maoxianensis]|uniref:Uncharacterized protein n=1 Tax=Streptomyces maoxianensis TaxID=1459942 RepID=A0ABV9FXY6_9ACTN
MSELGVALIAAGSAIAGSIATGWFTRHAGHRQAAAAKHAGDRQANALIATVQATLDEQRRARALEQRRQAYMQFLDAVLLPCETAEERRSAFEQMRAAMSVLHLEGPREVIVAAGAYAQSFEMEMVLSHSSYEEVEMLLWERQSRYLVAAQRALGISPDSTAPPTL